MQIKKTPFAYVLQNNEVENKRIHPRFNLIFGSKLIITHYYYQERGKQNLKQG